MKAYNRRGIASGFEFAFIITLLSVSLTARADHDDGYVTWQSDQSIGYLLGNISPDGAAKGAVVAARSKRDPDYFYHWIRDAALTMDVVVSLYRTESDPAKKAAYGQALSDFVDFSRKNQLTQNPSGGLGEPKFNADGTAFTGAWGRPQNDGPALRAIALVKLAHAWIDEGKESLVRTKLYDK